MSRIGHDASSTRNREKLSVSGLVIAWQLSHCKNAPKTPCPPWVPAGQRKETRKEGNQTCLCVGVEDTKIQTWSCGGVHILYNKEKESETTTRLIFRGYLLFVTTKEQGTRAQWQVLLCVCVCVCVCARARTCGWHLATMPSDHSPMRQTPVRLTSHGTHPRTALCCHLPPWHMFQIRFLYAC